MKRRQSVRAITCLAFNSGGTAAVLRSTVSARVFMGFGQQREMMLSDCLRIKPVGFCTVFGQHREMIVSKRRSYLLLIDNDMQKSFIDKKETMMSHSEFLREDLASVSRFSEIEAKVAVRSRNQKTGIKDMLIALVVYYNERSDQALLEAKRG